MLFVPTIDYSTKHWLVVFGRPGQRRVPGASRFISTGLKQQRLIKCWSGVEKSSVSVGQG